MIGSSGAISGIIGAFLFLFPTARIKVQARFLQSVLAYNCECASLGIPGLLVLHAILLSSGLSSAENQRALGARRRILDRPGANLSDFVRS